MSHEWNLPDGIRSNTLRVNDLTVHLLEAGDPQNPLLVLLHGFPELSYSWRKVMLPLAIAGYHVIAPDRRGFGRTIMLDRLDPSMSIEYDEDTQPFRSFNLATDIVALVFALGFTKVHAVIGHDAGSPVAAYCALIRPDMFQRVVMMSSPFTGPPSFPVGGSTSATPSIASLFAHMVEALAQLDPPRKHYVAYYSSPEANRDMTSSVLKQFLRAYYHMKSADWVPNDPHPLSALSAESFALLPEYYVMRLERTMPESVLPNLPSPDEVQANRWLTDSEIDVYVTEYGRTGFQGGLNSYRCGIDVSGRSTRDLLILSGKKVDVPAMFVAGKKDWGTYQLPGAVEQMKNVCVRMGDRVRIVDGAGHWVQQEKPDDVVKLLLGFFDETK